MVNHNHPDSSHPEYLSQGELIALIDKKERQVEGLVEANKKAYQELRDAGAAGGPDSEKARKVIAEGDRIRAQGFQLLADTTNRWNAADQNNQRISSELARAQEELKRLKRLLQEK